MALRGFTTAETPTPATTPGVVRLRQGTSETVQILHSPSEYIIGELGPNGLRLFDGMRAVSLGCPVDDDGYIKVTRS